MQDDPFVYDDTDASSEDDRYLVEASTPVPTDDDVFQSIGYDETESRQPRPDSADEIAEEIRHSLGINVMLDGLGA